MKTDTPLPGWKRFLFALSLPSAAVLLILYEVLDGKSLQCPFYRLTKLYCPGCGSGRAVQALLHGEFLRSFGYNPMLYLMGLPALYCVVHEYLRIVFPGLKLKPIIPSQPLSTGCLVLLAAYWVLRNIPAFSFLAPAS